MGREVLWEHRPGRIQEGRIETESEHHNLRIERIQPSSRNPISNPPMPWIARDERIPA
jgi:hypothetical protein